MKKNHQFIYFISLLVLFFIAGVWGIKHFHLSWVESTDEGATITLNFFIPMNQNEFGQHLQLLNDREDNNQFSYSLKWINKQVVEIKLKEESEIKGQKIKLLIKDAPSSVDGIKKSAAVMIQFKTDVEILSPTTEILISSTNPFIVQFNTPMNLKQMSKYFECDASFNIAPYEETLPSGEKRIDDTKFLFTPQDPLENGRKYILLFKAGMASKGGTLLKQDQMVMLKVDERPTILKTYPTDGDKWIGLYPRFTLQSKEAITGAMAKINGEMIKGVLTDKHHAYFLLDGLLKPETSYQIDLQTQVASGETSQIKSIHFTTTTLRNNRFWLDIRCKKGQGIYCYQGNKVIRAIACQISADEYAPQAGTYYLTGKAEVYENNEAHIGANYWMMITDSFGIHGALRNSYWDILEGSIKSRNIIISDEDAAWLYDRLSYQTMIIIRD